tara:strand:+ start:3184 stop:5259 length:2076 start_codon:yes stop_codon:yes gene_type:complete
VSEINLGKAWPLGSTLTKRGVNFSIAAPNASKVELLIFNSSDSQTPSKVISLLDTHKSGDYWHIEVEGLKVGCAYGFRVFNTNKSNHKQFYPDQVLLDPATRAISGWDVYKRNSINNTSSNIDQCLKSIVTERDEFDFYSHPRPRHPWNKTIIYELHVGGFTNQEHTGLSKGKKGTFLGLIEKIPYLKELGITTIELLPIFAFDPFDSPSGVSNYWGYSPINWFTPHISYVKGQNPLEARNQFRELIACCHENGLEVIIDVVYNHTTEGNQEGPVISWKGFDDSLYYYKNKKGEYLDVSGCGNSIAANRPIVRKLIIESMKCWANELGVDGFRFDLGIALTRGDDLYPLDLPPLFEEIESEPSLSELKLISEPWDCGGLYRLSDFPARRIRTWNGHFRDDIRKFWKADKSSTWNIKDRLMGSPNLYKEEEKYTNKSINFITSHDGFTLNDLVSFEEKHNLANGEKNRDGDNHNNSWNNGVEGPSTKREIEVVRNKQKRNLLTSLILSQGVPMILMGDEVGRSQGGNNNTWCQNNALGWMIWESEKCDLDLKKFLQRLIIIRKTFPEFFSPSIPFDNKYSSNENNLTNKLWLEWHGIHLGKPDWGSWSHTIAYSINSGNQGSALWLGLNAYNQEMYFELPSPISPWRKILDTKLTSSNQLGSKAIENPKEVLIESRSLVLMIADEFAKKIKD